MSNQKYKPIVLENPVSIDKLYSLHYFAYSKKFRFEGESHDFWELIYCDSGEARITDKGEEFVLSEGTAFLHAPNSFHNVIPNNTFTNVVIISFEGNLEPAAHCAGRIFPLDREEKMLIRTIVAEGRTAFSEPLNIVYQFELKLNPAMQAGCLQIIRNALESLILRLCRKTAGSSHSNTAKPLPHSQVIVPRILEILNERIKEKIQLCDLSAKLNYSETYIKKVFKSALNTSIIQYFIGMKIEKAKQFLSEKSYTVTQISEMLGFDTVQYFCRQFKRITNMTPTAYINSVTMGVL